MRAKKPYTDSEIAAFDDGFRVCAAVARASIVANWDLAGGPAAAAQILKAVELDMTRWLQDQLEKDAEDATRD